MNDQNKVAIFCILLVIAFSVWSKNDREDENPPVVGDDVFQTAQSDKNYSFVSLPKDNEAALQKISLLKGTFKENFSGDPFKG